MPGVVIFGTGSPILVDVEESLQRAGVSILAGVRNRPGDCFLTDPALVVSPDDVSREVDAAPFLVPLFNPGNRRQAAAEARSLGFTRPFSFVDPSVAGSRAFDVGPGLFIGAGCTLGAASAFGSFVFINRGATVGHHARCGDFVSIGPGAVIAGGVSIAAGALVGAGAVVLPNVSIGNEAVVGAGAVVTRDVPDGCLVIGNPARPAKTGTSERGGTTLGTAEGSV